MRWARINKGLGAEKPTNLKKHLGAIYDWKFEILLLLRALVADIRVCLSTRKRTLRARDGSVIQV